jgi:type II secretory pathway pseudopilin PulG
LEILVALFVIGIATSIFMQMYSGSLRLSKMGTQFSVAAQAAEEALIELQVNPEQFTWPDLSVEPGVAKPIFSSDGTSFVHQVELPSAMPSDESADRRERNLYRKFHWTATAAIQQEDSNFVLVVVTVDWKQGGRNRMFYLTSTVPRSVVEGAG